LYLKHYPAILKPLGKDLVFDLPNKSGHIYLTFDDGPHPEITPFVLDILQRYGAKATFFLVGRNAENHPEIVSRILREGHSIGNHTYEHVNGWKTPDAEYLAQVQHCAEHVDSHLFRPPYGQITRSQSRLLHNRYKIIMWSDLSADFDAHYGPEECFHYATRKVKAGSIVVFHDSEKAWPRLRGMLARCLEFYREQGFKPRPVTEALGH